MSYNNLKVDQSVYVDNSIISYRLLQHQPYANTTYNNNDIIRIPIQGQNLCTLLCESFLYIEGRLLKEDGTVNDSLNFVNNGIAFLFQDIRLNFGEKTIDQVRNPGIATTLKGYVSYTSNQSMRLANAGWPLIDQSKIKDDDGYFGACVPLSMLLGFAEDFRKIILNINQELVLVRSNTDLNAIVNDPNTETDTPKIILSHISWRVPHLTVSDVEKLKLYDHFDSGKELKVAFRSWELHEFPTVPQNKKNTWTIKTTNYLEKPRFVIFALQTDINQQANKNASNFNHCNMTNVKLYLNFDMFPYDNLNDNFNNKKWSILYEMYTQFQRSYYQKNSEPCLTPINYYQKAPIVVIDCSHQTETFQTGAIDIRLEFETSDIIPNKTSAFCLLLHDKLEQYSVLNGQGLLK